MAVMNKIDAVVETVLNAYPDALAIYRFGSWGTPYQRADSDLDIAVLLPYETAVNVDSIDWVTLNGELAYVSRTDRVDFVNLRTASPDMQAEILHTGDVLFCQDDDIRIEFEALTLTMHQALNTRRAALYQDLMARARALQP